MGGLDGCGTGVGRVGWVWDGCETDGCRRPGGRGLSIHNRRITLTEVSDLGPVRYVGGLDGWGGKPESTILDIILYKIYNIFCT